MADSNTPKQWLDQLKTLRDEAKVRAHLASKEIEGRLAVLDEQFDTFTARVESVGDAADSASKDVSAAFAMLGETLADGYKKVRDEIERQS